MIIISVDKKIFNTKYHIHVYVYVSILHFFFARHSLFIVHETLVLVS